MALGAGKYDEALTVARKLCGSTAAALIVIEGESGRGFACQMDMASMMKLPEVLRSMADQIEADLRRAKL